MRIQTAKVTEIATEMVRSLVTAEAIEVIAAREVEMDLEAVLKQYVRDEQAIAERAKDIVAARNLPQTEFAKMKRLVAEERQIKLGEEAVDYLLDQLVEILMHSTNVEEIFAEDVELRRLMREPLRRQAQESDRVEQQVRNRMKHVTEGGALWEVEYQRMMDDVRRRRGM
jgi:hypothetical protein